MGIFLKFVSWKKGNVLGFFGLLSEKSIGGKASLKMIRYPSVLFGTLWVRILRSKSIYSDL